MKRKFYTSEKLAIALLIGAIIGIIGLAVLLARLMEIGVIR